MWKRSSLPTRRAGLALGWCFCLAAQPSYAGEQQDICREYLHPEPAHPSQPTRPEGNPRGRSRRIFLSKPKPPKSPEPVAPSLPPVVVPLPELPHLAKKKIEAKKTELKREILRMDRLLDRGEYSKAAPGFAIGYAFTPTSPILYRLARSYQLAGNKNSEALLTYDRYQREVQDNASKDEAKKALIELCQKTSGDTSRLKEVAQHYIKIGKDHAASSHRVAITAYAEAYSFDRQPLDLFNMGQAYRRLGRLEEAYLIYERFLTEEPRAPERRETMDHLQSLRKSLALPIYKKGWFWGAVLGSAAVVSAVVVGVTLGLRDDRMTLEPRF